jgi:hypothetical protein
MQTFKLQRRFEGGRTIFSLPTRRTDVITEDFLLLLYMRVEIHSLNEQKK